MNSVYEAAVRSRLAYLDPDKLPSYEFITSSDDTQVYVCKVGDTVHVTFRGTSSIQDVLKDLDIKRTRITGKIKVHKGFYTQFQSVQIKLTKSLIKLTENAKRIIFTGHSLGGALAQIAAAYYGDVFEDLFVTCYTFGSPRVGNSHFVEWFSKNVDEHVRVVNEFDPVPMIPTMFYWKHANDICIKLTSDNRIKYINNDTPWYKRIFKLFNSDVKEHSCDEYVKRLED